MNILVTGASGNIGGKLIPRLVNLGYTVTCTARNLRRLERHQWQDVNIQACDVLNLESVQRVMPGIEVAYYLIHSMADGVNGYEERDIQAARNFGQAAREAGVKRIIYLGGLGVCENDLTSHLASRQYVGDILRESGVPVTEFRSAIIIGPGSMSFEMIRYLIERAPVILAPRWAATQCQPIAVENVLEYLIECLGEPRSMGKLYEIGGPEILSYKHMLLEYAKIRKLKRFLVPSPWLKMKYAAFIMKVLTPLPMAYLQPLLDGLRSEVVVHDPGALEDFNVRLIPFDESLQLALNRGGDGEIESLWAGVHSRVQAGRTHKTIEGMIIEQHTLETLVDPNELFRAFWDIGGKQGWLYANWLWKLRGWLDKLAGGPGMRDRKPDQHARQTGDVVDGFIVEELIQGQLYRLRNEMKSPGLAWMQFEARRRINGKTFFIQTAFFEPHGLAGLFYWYSLYPFHQLIFNGMARGIIKRAEAVAGKNARGE